ncbi:hypothetical protein J2I47_22960 [Fibrella sp. HMF5335]|uniref:NurA domain-containing protein n=1 Tax=Fibrella rubiginis TaxID=2817060 RepID=A0A939K705_9BACT|nr:hypothetical protein [Fibrella rubiginis]MBO0939428.1 hypothetical protein [Fibrella rubiginis]
MNASNQKLTDLITAPTSGQQEFENAILASLDMRAWEIDLDQSGFYEQIGQRVYDAVKQEVDISSTIRDRILPELNCDKLPFTGVKEFAIEQIRKAHNGLLFNGGVTAVDGTRITHDTLPMTITQIGICLVNYNGNYGSYMHRVFQRDLQFKGDDPVEELMDMLQIRKKRSGQGIDDDMGRFSEMAQRGLMAYAERKILMERAGSLWRIGHGNPFPYEMLVNFWASKPEVVKEALNLFTQIAKYERFVFVPSSPGRHLITIGNALQPREYVLIDTVRTGLTEVIDYGHASIATKALQKQFVEEYGDQVVIGLFKCSDMSPAHVFYAHRDHAHTAALIAIADGILQEHRGFPMLIDLADQICHSTFHPETFFASVRQAYADAGQPFRFLGERETRNR